MGIPGTVGILAQKQFEDLLRQRLLAEQQQRQAEDAEFDRAMRVRDFDLRETEARERAEDRALVRSERQKAAERVATGDRARSNIASVLEMPGLSTDDMEREIAGSALRGGIDEPKAARTMIENVQAREKRARERKMLEQPGLPPWALRAYEAVQDLEKAKGMQGVTETLAEKQAREDAEFKVKLRQTSQIAAAGRAPDEPTEYLVRGDEHTMATKRETPKLLAEGWQREAAPSSTSDKPSVWLRDPSGKERRFVNATDAAELSNFGWTPDKQETPSQYLINPKTKERTFVAPSDVNALLGQGFQHDVGAGAGRVPDSFMKVAYSLANMRNAVSQIEKTSKGINILPGPFAGPYGLLQRGAQKLGMHPELTKLDAQTLGRLAQFARAVGETGVLSDWDTKRVLGMLPTENDSIADAKSKLDSLSQIFDDAERSLNMLAQSQGIEIPKLNPADFSGGGGDAEDTSKGYGDFMKRRREGGQ